MSDKETLLLEIKGICDTLNNDIAKSLDSKANSKITAIILLLQNKLSTYLNDLA